MDHSFRNTGHILHAIFGRTRAGAFLAELLIVMAAELRFTPGSNASFDAAISEQGEIVTHLDRAECPSLSKTASVH